MATEIFYSQDKSNRVELVTEITIKNEVSTDVKINDANSNSDEVICTSEPINENDIPQSTDDSDIINTSNQNNEVINNIIILGSRIPNESKKEKRKNQTELELLGVDENYKDDVSDSEYHGFENESKTFRKYKLRKTKHPVSYTEPPDIKPKRRISSGDDRDMSCPVCQKEFENKVALRNHLRIHRTNKTVLEYTCSLCSKKFDKNADLIAHRKKHSLESFLCNQCKLAFSDYCDFLLHNYEHMTPQLYLKCSECGLHYRKSVYKTHILTHFDRKLSCDLCSFVTNGEHNLRTHIYNQHKYKLPCVECGKVYNNRKELDYHMSIHTGVKTFQCLYCGACFRGSSAVAVHTRIHTGERPYTCDVCGHKSRQSTDLKRHRMTHSNEKKYICDLCGKNFSQKPDLARHMRFHTNSCLYECPECDAKFVNAGGLKIHAMSKHTSERPYECAPCGKHFIDNSHYRRHCRAKYHLRNLYARKMNNKNDE